MATPENRGAQGATPAGDRNPDGTFIAGGGSPNPGGMPKWVKVAREAMRGELYGLAQRHLRWVLGGVEPTDASEAERAMYAEVTADDRTTAARLVIEYSMPKPKQSVAASLSSDTEKLVIHVVQQPREPS